MNNSGYIYVLINQSLPNCVKIGKTKRDVATSAAELSAATGVPTPFFVAYETFFNDCDSAELYIHSLLESAGVRLSSNREFFNISPSEAIDVVISAKSNVQLLSDYKSELSTVSEESVSFQHQENYALHEEPWADFLAKAESYRYGSGDELQDADKAIELFKLAAKLGSSDAYIQLGEMYCELNENSRGFDWIKNGADRGLPECWRELARIFSNDVHYRNYFGESFYNKENAIKCYRRFFKALNLDSERGVFTYLTKYIEILEGKWSSQDREILQDFSNRLKQHILENSSDDKEINDKFNQLAHLLASASS